MSSKNVPMELKKSAMAPKKPPLFPGSLPVDGSVGGSVGSVGGSVGSGSPVAGVRICPQTVHT